ncbi:MAG: D-aminoacylase [Clostridiaceae bacterium]|nr:D-aminoacylase [Clostridiaceae bacterium]
MLDLLLKNGLICDGTAAPAFPGDIAVKDGKIVEAAPSVTGESAEIVDVSGLVVAPAFIDMHSHSDSWFMADGCCQAELCQGVATEIVGQCGSSPFPRSVGQMTQLRKDIAAGKLSRMDAYQAGSFEKLQRLCKPEDRMSTNLVQLVGHNSVRRGVVGPVRRAAWEDEIQISRFLLEQNLDQGCWGLSLGLGYPPGLFAEQHELEELAKVCRRYDAIVSVHMRDEGDKVFESLEEMIDLGKATGAHIHIAHLKLGARSVWGRAAELYERICKARKEGVRLTADLYPYAACSTGLSSRLPDWVLDGGIEHACTLLEKKGLEHDAVLQFFREKYPHRADGDGFCIIGTGGACPEADGKTVGQLSEKWGLPVPETMIQVLLKTRGKENCIFFNMAEQDVQWLLAQDLLAIGSAACRSFDPAVSNGKPHPRTYGTFPRFLRLCREQKLCSLETAIHRITLLPAENVGLQDHGVLKPGMAADITVFDWKSITDTATYDEPFQKPIGICHVLIGGQFALRDGEQTAARLGNYLKKPLY